MNSKIFMSTSKIIVVLLFIFYYDGLVAQSTDKTPNVILIISDDMNDWIEPYGGNSQAQSPNLSRLAQESITFSNAWPAVSWCNPSRVSLITGIHPLRSGVLSNREFPFRAHLPNARTLIDAFNAKGYHTIGLGKILHKPSEDESESWDEYHPYLDWPVPKNFPIHGVQELIDNWNRTYDWGPIDLPLSEWGDVKSTDHAIRFLNSSDAKEKPFFLSIGYRLPHLPYYYPPEFGEFLNDIELKLPNDSTSDELVPARAFSLMKEEGVWESAVRSYLASIKFVDYNIGRLLDALKANHQLDRNTIIIFISDHGYHMGEKNWWGKVTLWNEALKTPCIIRFPELDHKAGSVIPDPINLLDIYPTLSERLDLEKNQWLSGKSLIGLMHGSDSFDENLSVIPNERFTYTDTNYKFIQGNDFEMLFDYQNDYEELNFKNSHSSGNKSLWNEYKARAINKYVQYSPFLKPLEPSGYKFSIQNGTIRLKFDDPPSDNSIYQLRLCLNANCQLTEDIDLNDDTIDLGIFNFLRIKAINPKFESDWSRKLRFRDIIQNSSLSEILSLKPEIEVYDVTGRKMLNQKNFTIDKLNLLYQSGYEDIYILAMKFNDQVIARKFSFVDL